MTEEKRRHPLIGQPSDDDDKDPLERALQREVEYESVGGRSMPGDAPVPLSTLVRRVMAEALRRAARKLDGD